MVLDIQSKEVIDKISDDLKVQPSMQIPRALMEKIQLVYNVNPVRLVQSVGGSNANAATVTIITTSTIKDTFLTGLNISVTRDVVAASTVTAIRATAFGKGESIFLAIRYEPTTAGNDTTNAQFTLPVKLERGTTVRLTHSSTTAAILGEGTVYFFETDPQ